MEKIEDFLHIETQQETKGEKNASTKDLGSPFKPAQTRA